MASPFPPLASGVADHTAFIVEHLSALADVTVCPTNTDAALPADARYKVAPFTADVYLDRGLDAVLSVAGNSLYHVPVLEYLAEYGGACLAHDNRMVEVYVAWLGGRRDGRAALDVQPPGDPAQLSTCSPTSTRWRTSATARLPGRRSADRARARSGRPDHSETGVTPHVLPFVPYNLPAEECWGERHASARRRRAGWILTSPTSRRSGWSTGVRRQPTS